jgi:hypothetical protein
MEAVQVAGLVKVQVETTALATGEAALVICALMQEPAQPQLGPLAAHTGDTWLSTLTVQTEAASVEPLQLVKASAPPIWAPGGA